MFFWYLNGQIKVIFSKANPQKRLFQSLMYETTCDWGNDCWKCMTRLKSGSNSIRGVSSKNLITPNTNTRLIFWLILSSTFIFWRIKKKCSGNKTSTSRKTNTNFRKVYLVLKRRMQVFILMLIGQHPVSVLNIDSKQQWLA